jgi:hypothetical protein
MAQEVHSRQTFVRQITEMADETKVQIFLRNSRQAAADAATAPMGIGGDVFTFIGEKSDAYEIGQECTLNVNK